MLMEGRFSNREDIPEVFEPRNVRILVTRVGNGEIDVDDVFRGETRHGCRPDVLDIEDRVTEDFANLCGQHPTSARPLRVVGDDLDELGLGNPVDPGVFGRVGIAVPGDFLESGHSP